MAACDTLGNWCAGLQQVFGKGSCSQVSSTDYVLKFESTQMLGGDEQFGMYKYHSNSLKKGDFIERPNEFVILKKSQAVDPNGTIHVFYRRDSTSKDTSLRRNCGFRRAACIWN